MANFEYKVVPAPAQGKRGKGAKGLDGRFANAMALAINKEAADGWEYMRAESLPSIDRTGITRKRIEAFRNVLVFRKLVEVEVEAEEKVETKEDAPKATAAPVIPAMVPVEPERADPKLTETEALVEETGEPLDEDDPDLREVVDEDETEDTQAEAKPKKPAKKKSSKS